MTEITDLLRAYERGDDDAESELLERLYDDLKQLASQRLSKESSDHTLQPSALVNETYIRLLGNKNQSRNARDHWEGRNHFFGAAAEAMRRILVESARSQNRKKRGGDFRKTELDPDLIGQPEVADEVLALDEALTRLAKIQPRMAELVNLRFFGGMTMVEAAEHLGISTRTADSDWAYARAWLMADIQESTDQ